ncbi:MAG: ribonuclease [Pseudomonadota bacterium]
MVRVAINKINKLGLAWVLCGAALLGAAPVHARNEAQARLQTEVALSELPRQGRDTYALIRQGGPFPYSKDGTVFGNRERLLPGKNRGYYREYTVATPGARTRGAKRIVCGGQPRIPDVCYYTSDHYASFRRIVE